MTSERASAAARPQASIVIASKNRRDELRVAVQSALAQTADVEILVIDDGSTDGTPEMMRDEFPGVTYYRSDVSRGYIHQRNRGAELARAEIIFSIDDDAFFDSPRTVQQTLAEFDDSRVGAVAIPYVEPNKSPVVRQRSPDENEIFVADTFIGTAHAIRKKVFLAVGGYRECLVHQGEEADLCIRMLARGYVVRLGTADKIHHMESPKRDFRRMDFYGRRNDILFAWHNVPLPWLPVHLAATSVNGVVAGIKSGRPYRMLLGTAQGWIDGIRCLRHRAPVPGGVYRLSRRLKKAGPQKLGDLEQQRSGLHPGRQVTDKVSTTRKHDELR